jgi:DNA polymerase (family 10)
MPVHNSDVADIFNRVADLLELEDANPFRIRAYRNAARSVSDLPGDIADKIESGQDLTELPGIGKDLAGKIREIVETGTLSQLKELEDRNVPDLARLMKLPGLGPKRVRALAQGLGITDRRSLKEAAEAGKVAELEGFGEKTQQSILEALEAGRGEETRIKLMEAEQRARSLVDYLKQGDGVKEITVAGSYRRRKETVGDLDILVTCRRGYDIMQRFVDFEDVDKVVSHGKTRSTVVLRSGLQVDLRVVPQVSYGAALHYFTGSKTHNISVRRRAVKRKLKINEYGVFKGEKRRAGKTETDVYAEVGLPYIEPELREGTGEVEAAENDRLPELVRLKDIRGDLHAHTKATDGNATLKEMAEAARALGYDYLAITEHSKKVTMAKGLDARRLGQQIEEIDRLNADFDDFRLLKGIEVDILEDGSLDLSDEILAKLDLRVCSVHYHQNLSRKKQTERIIRAMDNPYFNILAHPTGRLINARNPYEVDLEKVMQAALDRGCFLEVNADPDRLDLTDSHCRMAKEMGLKVAISTDAPSTANLSLMRFGVDQARRGWLEAGDILNTRSWKKLKPMLTRNGSEK